MILKKTIFKVNYIEEIMEELREDKEDLSQFTFLKPDSIKISFNTKELFKDEFDFFEIKNVFHKEIKKTLSDFLENNKDLSTIEKMILDYYSKNIYTLNINLNKDYISFLYPDEIEYYLKHYNNRCEKNSLILLLLNKKMYAINEDSLYSESELLDMIKIDEKDFNSIKNKLRVGPSTIEAKIKNGELIQISRLEAISLTEYELKKI